MRVEPLTTRHAKILSFGYSASSVAWNRFASLWLLKCGYLPRQVGAMKSLSLFGKLIAQPLWAGTADAGNPVVVLVLSLVLSSATLEAIRWGTRDDFEERSDHHHNLWSLLGLSSSSKERSHHAAAVQATLSSSRPWTVYWRVAALRVARSASSAASPVADAMVLSLARDGGEAWGRQRFWGSASWGIGSMLVGAIIDKLGLEAGLFGLSHLMSICLLLFLIVRVEPAWGLKQQQQQSTRDTKNGNVSLSEPSARDPKVHHRQPFHISVSMRNMQFSSTSPPPSASDIEKLDTAVQSPASDDTNGRGPDTPTRKREQMNGALRPTTRVRQAMTDGLERCARTNHKREEAASTDNHSAPHPLPMGIHSSPGGGQSKKKPKGPKTVLNAVARGAGAVRQSSAVRLVLFSAVAFGTAVVSVDSILYMQLETELQVSRTLSGLATAASTIATFPVFWSSAEIVKAYGHWTVLFLSQSLLPVRLLLHAGITKANVYHMLLPIQLLHGPMFAAWISAAVELVDRYAPPDLRCSVQSLLTMSYFTLGGAFGHLIWSTTFELYQGRTTYLLAAAFSFLSWAIFGIAAKSHISTEYRANNKHPIPRAMQSIAQLTV